MVFGFVFLNKCNKQLLVFTLGIFKFAGSSETLGVTKKKGASTFSNALYVIL